MTNALYSTDRQLLTRHQDSVMASLARRLDIARANNNTYLVALLEREKQQVTPAAAHLNARSRSTGWKAFAQAITRAVFGSSELQTCEVVDGSDRWWVASDPQTGQFVYADSEAELRLWIKENYQGK